MSQLAIRCGIFATFVGIVFYLWRPATKIVPYSADWEAIAAGEFVRIGGVKTHFVLRGEGPLIVMLHGMGNGISKAFAPEIIPSLAKNYTVLAIDYYGRGHTEHTTLPCDMRQLVALVAQVLLKLSDRTSGLTVSPFTLVGYSMGGPLAAGFAIQFPHLVEKLVLMAPAGVSVPIPLEGEIVKIPVLGDALFNVLATTLLPDQLVTGHYDWGAVDKEYQEYLRNHILQNIHQNPGWVPSMLSSLRHFPLNNFENGYVQIGGRRLPVMLLWGDSDKVCPYHGHRRLKELIPQLELYTVIHAGHDDIIEKDALEVAWAIGTFAANGTAPLPIGYPGSETEGEGDDSNDI